jgi:hypothetical protein
MGANDKTIDWVGFYLVWSFITDLVDKDHFENILDRVTIAMYCDLWQ